MPDQNKDPIKEAFAKAKQDILNLSSQIESLKREINSLKEVVKSSIKQQSDRPADTSTHYNVQNPAENAQKTTIQHINPTETDIIKPNPAQKQPFYGLKSPISTFSTGNRGVPADRQTDQQTDNRLSIHELNEPLKANSDHKYQHIDRQTAQELTQTYKETAYRPLEKVSQVLESLDVIKKDVRQKFKRLTAQEMSVFSAIYQLEEEGLIVDYSLISQKLSLTESSIRDYIQRLVKKGVPLIKNKENNKKIFLSISPDLKKIASLSTIIQLREL